MLRKTDSFDLFSGKVLQEVVDEYEGIKFVFADGSNITIIAGDGGLYTDIEIEEEE